MSTDNDTDLKGAFYKQRRYIVAFMLFFGTSYMYINRTNLSVTIVAMTNNYSNGTSEAIFNWSSKEQGIILSSFYYGYIMTQFIGGVLTKYVPANFILGIPIGVTGVLTMMVPFATSIGLYAVVAVKAIEGLLLGVTYPAIMTILSKWSPPLERSRMSLVCDVGTHFGTAISLLGAGILSEKLGWQSTFYVTGVIAIVWCIIWFLCIKESPEQDPFISENELSYILKSLEVNANDISSRNQPIPWRSIFFSRPVWALLVAHYANTWGTYTILTQVPTFLSDTANIDISSNGLLASLPQFPTLILGPLAGFLADFLQNKGILSTKQARKYFTCASYCLICYLMLAIAYLMSPVLSVVCLVLTVGVTCFAFAGYGANVLDIAPPFTGIVFGFINTIGTTAGIISPILTGFIVQNKDENEWKTVFYIAAAVYLSCGIFYWFMMSANVQP